MSESIENEKKIYFFPKLIKGYENDVGFIIEMERIIKHIKSLKSIQKKLIGKDTNLVEQCFTYYKNSDEVELITNMMASQLREALLLFHNFKSSSLYTDWHNWTENDFYEYFAANKINAFLKGFFEKNPNFNRDILRELRNRFYHYGDENAKSWFNEELRKNREDSKNKMILLSIIDKNSNVLGIGRTYDIKLYSDYLIFGTEHEIRKNLMYIESLQGAFLTLEESISRFLLEKNGTKENEYTDDL